MEKPTYTDMMIDLETMGTALRAPADDGRVSRRFVKGIAGYRFVRLAAKKPEAMCT